MNRGLTFEQIAEAEREMKAVEEVADHMTWTRTEIAEGAVGLVAVSGVYRVTVARFTVEASGLPPGYGYDGMILKLGPTGHTLIRMYRSIAERIFNEVEKKAKPAKGGKP